MVEWTGGILRSAMHRVTSAPGDQADVTRYVVGYFARPAGDAPMKRLAPPVYASSLISPTKTPEDDCDMNARDWEWHKLSAVREGNIGGSSGGRPIEPKKKLEDMFSPVIVADD